MDRQPVLEGERLLLRPLREADREVLFAFAGDPLLWEQHPVRERGERPVFDEWMDELLGHGGALAAIDRATGQLIATSSYTNLRPEGGGMVEIGATALDRTYWGGWANRAMKRMMLDHAFANVSTVEFLIGEHNWRSRRAIEKIGGALTNRVHVAEFRGRLIPHLIYEITRKAFAGGPLGRS